jgi:lycopene beta-cyclase
MQQRPSFQRTASPASAIYATPDETCDVLVLGSGPAGRSIATLLGSSLNVILADQNLDREWPPNYGVWRDEWDAVLERYSNLDRTKYGECIDREWQVTDCFFGGSFNIPTTQRTRLERPYCRVDRTALRKALNPGNYRELRANHVSKAIGVNLYEPAGSLVHDKEGATIILKSKDGSESVVRTKLVVDTTGHETQLVLRDTRAAGHRPPGFQIAYGCLVEVTEDSMLDGKIGPYDMEAMTLFDYRTDHFDGDEVALRNAAKSPTFMYAMPLKGNRIFFEETSLVARPAMSFQECKDRCFRRLKHLGIDVIKLEEEEFCYIPMGGALPVRDQRVIGLGGSSAMVHPSTGYHLCRCMMGASDMANAIIHELSLESTPNLDRAAASAYHAIWTPEAIRQRNFAVFGGEYLMERNVVGLRGFFDGFFRLPLEMWGGFLAGWKGLPNNDKHESWAARMWFGLNFVARLPPDVALSMLTAIVTYSVTEGAPLLQSVTPFLGEPQSYEWQGERNVNVGDVAAKEEARQMIQEAKLMDVPVDFDKDGKATVLEIPFPELTIKSVQQRTLY